MRASRALSIGLVVAVTVVAATSASAHRRDEYLQAARIQLQPGGVDVELDLTPGIEVAGSIIATLDRDGDGSLSATEQRGYADLVVGATRLTLDGTALPLRLASATFPDLAGMSRGEGTIRMQAHASLTGLTPGSHQLFFRNTHLAGQSAYLANALVPENPRIISVTAQRRDPDQTELTIVYAVRAEASIASSAWLLLGLTVVAFLVARFARVPSLVEAK